MSESLMLSDPAMTEAAGAALAKTILEAKPSFVCICLEGELGAGKTTFARGFLRGFGHAGRVPSPTYTLVEPYDLGDYRVCHMDLYRLQDGAELEYLGISEMTEPGHVLLIEWPSRAADSIPDKDMVIKLEVIPEGRELVVEPISERGHSLAAKFAAKKP
jgi:tRNA threonylcarbamoyladenosine biosynthesis protein TsaE